MKRRAHGPDGFSLVEITLALGIMGFALSTLLFLLPVSLQSNRASAEQTVSSEIVSAISADLRATPATVPPGQATTTQRFQVPIPANPLTASPAPTTLFFGGTDTSSTTLNPDSRYRVVLTFLPNKLAGSTDNSRQSTPLLIDVYWPAAAPLASAAGHVQVFVALDRN